jgi:uncharacterized protein (DUF1800 family)
MSILTDLITSRLTFGRRFNDPWPCRDANWQDWLTAQLAAPSADDGAVLSRLAALQPTYWTGTTYAPYPIDHLFKSAADLWLFTISGPRLDQQRAYSEVIFARWIRAAFSPWQIFEVMVDFWYNHFSVDASKNNYQLMAMSPVYDRIIRANALGNFRSLLGAVTKSPTMMYYLDQALSSQPIANENFARELLELHTLGIGRYLGRTTPSGMSTSGYSDQDVQEAARVLTGWSIADGTHQIDNGSHPNTGIFTFWPVMHDTGAKKLFNFSISAGGGEEEGERLLDYLAYHRGTAENIATKLYIRFVGDNPPANDPLVQTMADTFMQNGKAANQIALVIQSLINHSEFAGSAGAKVKTPFEFMISVIRATNCKVDPTVLDDSGSNIGISELLLKMGAPMFTWPTPKGPPDYAQPWTGSNGMIQRWAIADQVVSKNSGVLLDRNQSIFSWWLQSQRALNTPKQAAGQLGRMILGNSITGHTQQALSDYAQSLEVLGDPSAFSNTDLLQAGLRRLVGAIAATAEFQAR